MLLLLGAWSPDKWLLPPAFPPQQVPVPPRRAERAGIPVHTHTHLPLFVHATQRPDATTLKSIHNAQSALTAAAVRRT